MASPKDGRDTAGLLELLRSGALTLRGLLPWSSNYTFLGEVADGDSSAPVVYKPVRGERPLWDFPRGTLAKRETAAYHVSQALGWNLVPPTVLRDGPHGLGSVQLFVETDQDDHFFTMNEDPRFRRPLQELALFDVIVNNADRKGGHCLRGGDDAVIAIDQGLCFHVEPKLRTVIWDFAGDPIPDDLLGDLHRLHALMRDDDSALMLTLERLLSGGELRALRARIAALERSGCYPDPPEDRRAYPWPPI